MGWATAPQDRLFAWHLAVLVGTLAFLGPASTLWAFWAETAGLTVAWFVLASRGRLPFSVHAYLAIPFVIVGALFVQGISSFVSAVSSPLGSAPLSIWLDVEMVIGLLLGTASTFVWLASPTGQVKLPAAGPTDMVAPPAPRRSYPSPLVRVVIFEVAWLAAVFLAQVLGFLFFPVVFAFGFAGLEALALAPFYVMALAVGGAQLVLDRRARARAPLGAPPAAPHCPNCQSLRLFNAKGRDGKPFRVCYRCGSVLA